ncbi:MAG TPA: DUF4785 domain-containing protein, partial [Nannocystaceae bacterium]|nr:DUF4785 domain-containing protein [Nannocystaceae bacterium]
MKTPWLAFVVFAGCSESHVRSFAAVSGDLAPQRLIAPHDDGPVSGASAAVSHARPLDPAHALAVRPEPRPDRSRRWWTKVTASELVAGVALPTTAAGATVSLRPLAEDTRDATGVDPNALVLVDPDGVAHAGDAAMEHVLGWDELRAGESPFAPGTSAFRIDPELGHGAWQLRVDAPLGEHDVLVHVVEAASALELVVRTDAPAYLHGHTVVVDVDARHDGAPIDVHDASARARSPAGETTAIELDTSSPGRLRGELVLAETEVEPGAAWVVEV